MRGARDLARAAAVAGLGCLLAVAGCSRVPDVVKIGVAQPLSNGLAPLGKDMVDGARMAIDEINAADGVNVRGKRVHLALVVADDQGSNDAGDASRCRDGRS